MSLEFHHTIVICTQTRTWDLLTLLNSINKLASANELEIIIVENSGDVDQYDQLLVKLEQYVDNLHIRLLTSIPGLTRSRNLALACVTKGIVHFLDDDVEIISDYFYVADKHFKEDSRLAGLAPFIESPQISKNSKKIYNEIKEMYIRRFNLEGKLTASGKAFWLINQKNSIEVDWLPGCSMSYRYDFIGDLRFAEILEKGPLGGYALGEDVDFSTSIAERGRLVGLGGISIIHKLAPNERNNWVLMDEGIGRWLAYLQRTKPQLVKKKFIIFSLILDAIKIQVLNLRLILTGRKNKRKSLKRIHSYWSELSNPTLI